MNGTNHLQLRELLKAAKLPARELQLEQDLWPRVLTRLQQPHVRVTPLDWVLIVVAISSFLAFPEVIPALVCHL